MKDLLNIDWELEFSKYPNDVEKQWSYFKTKFIKAENECVPRKIVSVNGNHSKKLSIPLNDTNLKKIKNKNALWSKMRKNLATEKQELQYRRLRNQVRRLTKKGKKLLEKISPKRVKPILSIFGNMHKLN